MYEHGHLRKSSNALFQEIELEISLLGSDLSGFDRERQLLDSSSKRAAK
jgi:hypothetical protein